MTSTTTTTTSTLEANDDLSSDEAVAGTKKNLNAFETAIASVEDAMDKEAMMVARKEAATGGGKNLHIIVL